MSTESPEPPAPVRVQLLGPVRAWRGEVELSLGPARQRTLFTVLALRANQIVSREELVDAIWGDTPPSAVDSSLYTYVSRLRRTLEPVRSKRTTGQTLVSTGAGYCLGLEPDMLDVREFDRLRQEAQHSWDRRDVKAARAALDQALELWRGDALAGIDGPFAAQHRVRLNELRLNVMESRAQMMLEAGEVSAAVAELLAITSAYPLRETPRALLMMALHRAGRDDEALEVYRETRELLVEQLGIEPSGQVRRAHDEIITARDRVERMPRLPVPPRPKVLIGRETELTALRAALAGVLQGKGTVIWVEGEPGIGKTALLATGLADAADRGCEVLWQAGDEVGMRVPLSMALACLDIDSLSRDPRRVELAGKLPGRVPKLAFTHQSKQPEVLSADRLIGLVDRLAAFVGELCADSPVVLVLEDLQWGDDASLMLWRRLAKATRHLPLLLVGSCRRHERRADLYPLRTVVPAGNGVMLQLGPLDETASTAFVREKTGTQPSEALLAMAACADGHPQHLLEIVEAMVRDNVAAVCDHIAELGQEHIPSFPTVNAVLTRWLSGLSDTTREALRWAALLGVEFDLDDLATVMKKQASDLLSVVEEASAASVLEESGHRLAFRHPLVQRALYETLPVTVRVALHRQAAEALDAAGVNVVRVTEQLLAGPVPVDARVTQWLMVNTNAIASRSPALAVELLRRVVRSDGIRDKAFEVLTTRLARLLFWLGTPPVAEALAVLRTTKDPNRAAEMRLMLAYVDHSEGENERALEVLRQTVADPSVSDEWRARHHSLQARVERRALDDLAPANEALEHARQSGDAFAVAHASENLWEIASVLWQHTKALEHIEQGLAAIGGDPAWSDLELCLLDDKVFTLHNLDDLEEAERTLDAARHLVARRGLASGLHVPAAVHHYWRGQWCEALTELEAVMLDRLEITAYGLRQRNGMNLLYGIKALIAGHQDDSSAMETNLKAAAEYPHETVETRDDFFSMAKSVAAEQLGRPDEALRALLPLLRDDYPRIVPRHQWLPRLARLALDQKDRTVAEAALVACQPGPDREAGSRRASVAAQWCRGLLESDPEALSAVVTHFAAVGRKVEQAVACEDLAVLLAKHGRADDARTALYEASTVYTGLNAAWDARRAESRLKPFDIHGPTIDHRHTTGRPLDEAERRVAELVAAGWPNSDIATSLRMSRNTVQMIVSQLLQKLGVDSRLNVTRQLLDRYVHNR
ncbi:BTAD domain-containing putative transcriptional regulator [Lentzea roselyniae]|uniref:BTAD domain-containing putative transcriptional regulator n=1 Tax=Lentzea roselyniae TaxID=531940 RepID=A0ABP7C978_9PSEU